MGRDRAAEPPAEPHSEAAPVNWEAPQFTIRAVLTGMVLGAILCTCNIYAGLKIGWGFNMSVTAALLSFGVWNGLHHATGKRIRHWGILENNINQTACSSAASVSSAGLVAPIPALAMLTGQTLDWSWLALWCFSVMMVGITIAIPLRHQMIVADKLPFAFGIAAAETLREMYARGSEALARVAHLVGAAVIASVVALLAHFKILAAFMFPGTLYGLPAASLTLALKPSLLLVGVGGLIGFRACASLLLGAILAYVVIAPPLIQSGHLQLQVSEPLDRLPPGLSLPAGAHPRAQYDYDRHHLQWSGVMTVDDRDEMLGKSDYPPYAQAVHKLYARSQLAWRAPLAQLPAGVDLAGTPLRYDAQARALVTRTALDDEQYAALEALSEDPAYQAALTELHERHFDVATVRYAQTSVPLAEFPRGFIVPRDLEGVLHVDRARHRLILRGPLHENLHDRLVEKLAAYRATHPERIAEADALREAVLELERRQAGTHLPPDFAWPADITFARYDDGLKALVTRGPLTAAQATRLRQLPSDPDSPAGVDFAASIERLIAAASLTPAEPGFRDLNRWLLWPGVTLMVVSSIVAVGFSWRSFLALVPGRKRSAGDTAEEAAQGTVPARLFMLALGVALILSVVMQVSLFQIIWWAALFGVLLTFVLALVAARVSGETSITPVGAMGKVTQLVFGILVPKSAAANLMAANVTGGAASQCADLLHDLKCGYLLGAIPRLQTLAQIFGALSGAMAGAAIYMILVPDPGEMLLTEEWAAPAVAAWKAVAELFMVGFEAIPTGTPLAMLIAAIAGVLLPVLDRKLPAKYRWAVPSAASLGLAFVIQAYSSFAMFFGGLAALIVARVAPGWSGRSVVAVCAGVIAGESLTGVGIAIESAAAGLFGG
jgi:uncharacterized oligopeptide transporter (OPT) family protein